MRKIILALILLLSVSGPVLATTLDELNNPLLNKGQWRFDGEAEYDYAKTQSRSDDALVPAGSYNAATETNIYSFSPDISYGLTDKIQLSLNTAWMLPYRYGYTVYTPAGPTDYAHNKSWYNAQWSENITWRPSQSWEFYLTPTQAIGKDDSHDIDLATGLEDRSRTRNISYGATTGLTWLSNPQPGNKTSHNRADLDGLINPLLNKKQVRVSLPITYQHGSSTDRGDTDLGPGDVTNWNKTRTRLNSLIVTPAVSYGIMDRLQADISFEYQIPKLGTYHMIGQSYDESGGNADYRLIHYRSRTQSAYSPNIRLTHRFNQNLQWYISGDYQYSKGHANTDYFWYRNGPIFFEMHNEGTFVRDTVTTGLGLTLISSPKREGRPLASDLDGLKNPLLEKRQIRLDLSCDYQRQRYLASDTYSYRYDNYILESTLTYGILDKLQGYLSAEVQPHYSFPVTQLATTESNIYPLGYLFGAGLTYRPNQRFELYIQASISPNRYNYKQEITGPVVRQYNFYKERFSQITLGGTILW